MKKQITSYTHPSETSSQQPDTEPGPYYISAVDGPKFALASGPYENHGQALALVEKARSAVVNHDAWAAFASFGTVRMQAGVAQQGALQRWGYDLNIERAMA